MIYLANRSLPTMEAFTRESGGSLHKARQTVAELRSLIWRRNFKYFVKMITLVL